MNAPEKIYLQEPTKVRTEKKYDNDVEYIRTDAFIEKVAEWIKNKAERYVVETSLWSYFDYKRAVEDFVNYMKGE